jgi:lysophospholipase L1-like esterase
MVPSVSWHRYVAIGDSSTEGMGDPDGTGGFRGWADRLAEHLAAAHGDGFEYANLAIRGKTTGQIQAEQVPVALALRPDLVSVIAGMNDILTVAFDPEATAARVEEMFAVFTGAGADVLTFTLPDPTPNLWFTWMMRPLMVAFNEALRRAADRTGVMMVDVAAFTEGSDPRLWSDDRLHGNSAGHERVAHACANGLGLPSFDDSWRVPLPPAQLDPLVTAVRADLIWMHQYALPWLWRRLRGRSLSEGVTAKRPAPEPVRPS